MGDRWGCRRAAAGALVDDAAAVRLTSLASRMSAFPVVALAQRWTDATALHANFPCRTSNMAIRRIGTRPARRAGAAAYRIGAAVFGMVRLRVRKGENGASLQAEIRGLPPFSNSANLSHLVFCENTACESHYCSCIGTLDSVISGPIVAFSANSGSIICSEAPSWRFLPISPGAFAGASDWVSAECFCEGLWPSFGSGRACEGLLQGVLWNLSHDLLRRLAVNVLQRRSRACVWGRASSRNETPCLRQCQ